MGKHCTFFGLLLFLACFLDAQENIRSHFDWQEIPALPASHPDSLQPGLAGAFSGVHNNVMIIAGGANFPSGLPWEGGEKRWHDEIYVCEKTTDGYQWLTSKFSLPRPLAYGVSISTEKGLVCIGGTDESQCFAEVFLLRWDQDKRKIKLEEWPPLPVPLGFMSGARVEDVVYVAGGQETMDQASASKHFFSLDLSQQDDEADFKWKSLPSWEGPPRILSVSVGQGNGLHNCFFLFSGRNVQPGKPMDYLSDAYSYNPTLGEWKTLSPLIGGQCVMAGTAIPSGAGHIFVFGGADGKIGAELETLDQKIRQLQQLMDWSAKGLDPEMQANVDKIKHLQNKKNQILAQHPGFSSKILNYYALTDQWTQMDQAPKTLPVTTNAFYWEDQIIIPSGELRPGVRTPEISGIAFNANDRPFGTLNYMVLAIYFMALLWIGWYFSGRQKSTEDYFKGGGRVPWWAAGLSIFGTVLSAISFMAIPAKTFATDWSYLLYNFSPFFIAPVIVGLFLPFFHKLNITTAYEYLEERFNLLTRILGSISFMLYQFGRIAIVLYLPAIALNIVTGFPIMWCIVLMGIVSVIYTMMGGIEGVIWTDVLQVIVLMGGAFLCVGILISNIEGGWSEVIAISMGDDKYNILDFTLDLNQPGFWVVLIGGIFSNIVFYGTDQTVVQRYVTATNLSASAKSVWTNAILVLPATVLFFAIGTILYVYYKNSPEALQPGLEATDAVFPWYIVSELPQGISGLLIAGVFAASMSSLSSSMNSVAAAYTTDFHQRFAWKGEPLQIAKWSTFIVGFIGTLFALWMASSDIKSLWDEFIKVVGLITGGLGGLFVLGMISKRANAKGALIGLAFSAFIQLIVANSGAIHLMLFTTTGFLSCIIVGYLASLVFD